MDYILSYTATKRARLRVSKDGTIKISLPRWLPNEAEIIQTFLSKAPKLQAKIQKHQIQKTHVIWEDFVLIFWQKESLPSLPITYYLKKTLLIEAQKLIELYSLKMWVEYSRLSIRDTKSRWWSCSSNNAISLSLKLVHLPKDCLEYVIVHELTHIIEKNHSPRFRALVERYFPESRKVKAYFKTVHLT